MTSQLPAIQVARQDAEKARARLMATAQRLQLRLSPGNLAQNAWDGAKEKSAEMAESAVDAVRKRPVAATGVVAAIALFLAREPLLDLTRNVTGKVRKSRKTKTKTKSTEKSNDGQSQPRTGN